MARTRRTTTAAIGLALGLALGLGLVLAGCDTDGDADPTTTGVVSIDKDGDPPPEDADDGVSSGVIGRLDDRREPTSGVVEVDGSGDTLTGQARTAFLGARDDIAVTDDTSGETRSFERLCLGDIDIADTSRPITAEEYDTCRARGFDVVQFQVAADAVVLAIRSQTDVGTDCLSTDQVRAAFGADSPITDWSQLDADLDRVPLAVGGPTVRSDVARSFGHLVLGSQDPMSSDFRDSYVAADTEAETLRFVTGPDEDLSQADPGPIEQYGRVGLFSQGFYATYQDRLRPFEIEVSDGDDQADCILPSAQTILDGRYPLSRPLLLTVTTRSLQRPEVRAFLRHYLDHSAAYADAAGVVAMPRPDLDRQLVWLRDDAVLPRFGFVDGRFGEIIDDDATQAPASPTPETPAR